MFLGRWHLSAKQAKHKHPFSTRVKEHMDRRIICSQCQNQLSITWISQMIRCSYCQTVITITRNDYLSKEQRISYRVRENQVPSTANSSGAERGRCLERLCGKMKIMSSSTSSPSRIASPSSKPSSRSLSSIRPKQRAVLCGVTYSKKRKYKLKGTLADVKNMKELLMGRFKFPEEGIRVLTEEETDSALIPTRKNIEDSLKWLVDGCQSGDSLVFFFSGHGLRQPEFNEDEHDGFDETICPVDFMEQGMIHDNDINAAIVRPLTSGVILHAIVDACHSGTILDLPYVYDHINDKWDDNSHKTGAKGTSGGLAISFSACADHEMAADTSAFEGKTMNGAMTYSFTKAIKDNPDITYDQLLTKVHQEITKANEIYCLNSRRLARVFHRKISQEPLLSSSTKFNVKQTKFSFYPRIAISKP